MVPIGRNCEAVAAFDNYFADTRIYIYTLLSRFIGSLIFFVSIVVETHTHTHMAPPEFISRPGAAGEREEEKKRR